MQDGEVGEGGFGGGMGEGDVGSVGGELGLGVEGWWGGGHFDFWAGREEGVVGKVVMCGGQLSGASGDAL